jgi:hypothetical protein
VLDHFRSDDPNRFAWVIVVCCFELIDQVLADLDAAYAFSHCCLFDFIHLMFPHLSSAGLVSLLLVLLLVSACLAMVCAVFRFAFPGGRCGQ